MNIGLFDMDGSLADYEGQLLEDIKPCLHPDDWVSTDRWGLWEAEKIPRIRNVMELIKKQPGWWANLPMLEDGFKILNIAKEIGYECHILTKGPKRIPNAWKEKVEWCQARLGEKVDVHITSDKALVYGRFLYDDFPEYMDRWLTRRPRGIGIMPVNRNNKDYTHPRVIKWDGTNVGEVRDALLSRRADLNLAETCNANV